MDANKRQKRRERDERRDLRRNGDAPYVDAEDDGEAGEMEAGELEVERTGCGAILPAAVGGFLNSNVDAMLQHRALGVELELGASGTPGSWSQSRCIT